jgi:hypothetical protein
LREGFGYGPRFAEGVMRSILAGVMAKEKPCEQPGVRLRMPRGRRTGIIKFLGGATIAAAEFVAPVTLAHAASDGQMLCMGKETIDDVRPIPQSLAAFAKKLYGEETTYGDPASTTVYRCMHNVAYICQVGNGFSCDRPSRNPYNSGVQRYCRQHPGSGFVPMATSGRGTVYIWKCVGKHAAIKTVEKTDERGFRAGYWTAVLPGDR